jgi:Ni/Co efflux regulator RcnB
MKKFVLAAVAASLLATPVMAAPQRADHGAHRTVERTTVVQRKVVRNAQPQYTRGNDNRGWQNNGYAQNNRYAQNSRTWQRGQRFDNRYAPNYRQVDYRRNGRLYAPPSGYQWVQSGNDAVLVALASGLIGAVLGGVLAN